MACPPISRNRSALIGLSALSARAESRTWLHLLPMRYSLAARCSSGTMTVPHPPREQDDSRCLVGETYRHEWVSQVQPTSAQTDLNSRCVFMNRILPQPWSGRTTRRSSAQAGSRCRNGFRMGRNHIARSDSQHNRSISFFLRGDF